MTAEQLRAERDEALADGLEWFGEIQDGINACRPCPWVDCRYHLDHGIESCALDVANQGRHTSVELAKLLGVTRQRVEYIEKQAIERARKRGLPGV